MAMEEFNEEKQRAKVAAGLSAGGPFFAKPNLAPAMRFVDGVPAEVRAKMFAGTIEQQPIQDAWVNRRLSK